MHTCIYNTYIHSYVHTYIHTLIHRFIHTYIHTYIYMYIYNSIYLEGLIRSLYNISWTHIRPFHFLFPPHIAYINNLHATKATILVTIPGYICRYCMTISVCHNISPNLSFNTDSNWLHLRAIETASILQRVVYVTGIMTQAAANSRSPDSLPPCCTSATVPVRLHSGSCTWSQPASTNLCSDCLWSAGVWMVSNERGGGVSGIYLGIWNSLSLAFLKVIS